MAARMEVVVVARQVLHQRQIPGHHLRRQSPDALVLGAGVHDIGGVGHNGAKAVLRHQLPQPSQVRRVNSLGPGPPGVADKALEGVGPDGQGRLPHLVEPARGGQVRA